MWFQHMPVCRTCSCHCSHSIWCRRGEQWHWTRCWTCSRCGKVALNWWTARPPTGWRQTAWSYWIWCSYRCVRALRVHMCVCEPAKAVMWPTVGLVLVLGDATILSLNCDISTTRYCNRTLVAETIISRQRLHRINSDNRSTNRLRMEFN